jgi:TatA/E family protein of Tat protein translocase
MGGAGDLEAIMAGTSGAVTLALLPLGGWELVVIVVFGAVLIFGNRLPELGRSLGRSITEFKKGLSSGGEEQHGAGKPGGSKERETNKSEDD